MLIPRTNTGGSCRLSTLRDATEVWQQEASGSSQLINDYCCVVIISNLYIFTQPCSVATGALQLLRKLTFVPTDILDPLGLLNVVVEIVLNPGFCNKSIVGLLNFEIIATWIFCFLVYITLWGMLISKDILYPLTRMKRMLLLLRIKVYSRNATTSFSHITQLINMLIELIKVKTLSTH